MSDITDLCRIIHRGIGLNFEDLAKEIIAAGFHRDRTITTAEELDALASGAVIRDRAGDPLVAVPGTSCMAFWLGDEAFEPSSVRLPATVLWQPEPGDE